MSIISVTARRRNGRAMLSPQSHVLTREVGNTISATWSVTNTGGVRGFGALDMVFTPVGTPFGPASVGFFGALTSIAVGVTVTLTVSGAITTLLPGTTYNAELRVIAATPATVGPGGVHPFTLTISVATPVLGPLDLFFAPLVNWTGNPLRQATWLEEIAAFYGMISSLEVELRAEGEWIIFSVSTLQDITQNFGLAPSIPGLNATGTSTDPVDAYLAEIAAATTHNQLDAIRGLIVPYVLPIVYPTSYLATGFEVDYFKGVLNQTQFDTLYNAYVAKWNTLPS